MFKKWIAIFIVFTLFLVPFSTTLAAPVFKDVTDNFFAKSEFDYLIEKGILTADPTLVFGVQEEITRIEAVEILAKALNLDLENRPVPTYTDVSLEDEKFPYIAAIVDEKIMSGFGNGEFKPNDKLTRGQMAVILSKAFKLTGTTMTSFKDVKPTSWAYDAIQVFIANKITNGFSDYTFKPNAFISKSNYVLFLARIMNPAFRKDLPEPKPEPIPIPELIPELIPEPIPEPIPIVGPVFKDVTDNFFAKSEFDYLVEKGILTADPTLVFGVQEEITRIEAVEILAKALNLDLENRSVPIYTDITPEDEKFPYIAAIVDEKIMSGFGNGEFKPNDKLTRAQMAVILSKAFKLTGTTTTSFKDVKPTYWAYDAIQVFIANKITNGFSDYTFKPNAFISKSNYVLFLARIMNPAFRKDLPKPEPIACEKPSSKKTYKVNVQVTSLWHDPNKTRTVDKPSLTNPVDISKWTRDMSLTQKWWLVGKTDTQALYGDEVTVLKSSGNWHQIAIKDQYVPYLKAGYPGWVPKSHVTATSTDVTNCSIAIVTNKIAPLYNPVDKKKYMDISYSTILPVIKTEGDWLHVQTPGNGVKLLKKSDAKTVKNYKAVPKPTQATIVNEAKRFLNLPYLWAGTSALGYDCSGIIYAVYKNHGILIPRDSFYQATKGTAVAKKNLQPGDLVFFAGAGGKGKVYHVGLYIGSGKMLHAPNASSKVKIESISAGVYKNNYSGARRYLK